LRFDVGNPKKRGGGITIYVEIGETRAEWHPWNAAGSWLYS